jgi:hypothetical protein
MFARVLGKIDAPPQATISASNAPAVAAKHP